MYFEVAKDAFHPFVMTVNDLDIRVLGTHFNISGYPGGEGVQTTLLERKVQVQRAGEQVLLLPGQLVEAWAKG